MITISDDLRKYVRLVQDTDRCINIGTYLLARTHIKHFEDEMKGKGKLFYSDFCDVLRERVEDSESRLEKEAEYLNRIELGGLTQ